MSGLNGLTLAFGCTIVVVVIFNLWLNTKSGKKWLNGSE